MTNYKCACPWCPKEVEPGCEALVSGEATCKDHDYRNLLIPKGESKGDLTSEKAELK